MTEATQTDQAATPTQPKLHVDFDLTSFVCPRCGETVGAEFYGPCDACREQLRATVRGEGADVAAAEYEPKMNVTPNAVASKE